MLRHRGGGEKPEDGPLDSVRHDGGCRAQATSKLHHVCAAARLGTCTRNTVRHPTPHTTIVAMFRGGQFRTSSPANTKLSPSVRQMLTASTTFKVEDY